MLEAKISLFKYSKAVKDEDKARRYIEIKTLINFLVHQIFNFLTKGLINLSLRDPQELQETAHTKSYKVDTSPKYTEYIFQYESGSSLLIIPRGLLS